LDASTLTEKENFQKRKQMQRITNTIRQTESKTVNQQDPDRIQKAPREGKLLTGKRRLPLKLPGLYTLLKPLQQAFKRGL
jgi:hypothetical protein